MPLFHSTFSMCATSLGRKQVTKSGEMVIMKSKNSKINFEENAKCSSQRAFSDDMTSFLNKKNG